MAVAVSPAPRVPFSPAPRSFAALPGAQSGGAGLLGCAAAGVAQAPADIWYGSRVGIVSCREQRYVAAFPRGAGQAGAGDGFRPWKCLGSTPSAGTTPRTG
ncbi:unnamed protein product [Prorocentrum cordatum]|uniref:Uncharacterized protein n=1 Tax=Prorocentrum cordatum TaxID=2364126 RepID=A0ABN9WLH1_9DINO|nr:unnamed protein product [Polarella glacialis]